MNMNETWKKTEEIRMNDKYDKGIKYLTAHPEDIEDAWGNPGEWEGRGGELFGFVGPEWTKNDQYVRYGRDAGPLGMSVMGTCGCLQQIREAYKGCKDDLERGFDMFSAVDDAHMDTDMTLSHWPDMWAAIASDRRLPTESDKIMVEDLPVFAEWQRAIDEQRRADGMDVPY